MLFCYLFLIFGYFWQICLSILNFTQQKSCNRNKFWWRAKYWFKISRKNKTSSKKPALWRACFSFGKKAMVLTGTRWASCSRRGGSPGGTRDACSTRPASRADTRGRPAGCRCSVRTGRRAACTAPRTRGQSSWGRRSRGTRSAATCGRSRTWPACTPSPRPRSAAACAAPAVDAHLLNTQGRQNSN